jgi:hypothetical protein
VKVFAFVWRLSRHTKANAEPGLHPAQYTTTFYKTYLVPLLELVSCGKCLYDAGCVHPHAATLCWLAFRNARLAAILKKALC